MSIGTKIEFCFFGAIGIGSFILFHKECDISEFWAAPLAGATAIVPLAVWLCVRRFVFCSPSGIEDIWRDEKNKNETDNRPEPPGE